MKTLRILFWSCVVRVLAWHASRAFIAWQLAKANHGPVVATQRAYVRAHRLEHKARLRLIWSRA